MIAISPLSSPSSAFFDGPGPTIESQVAAETVETKEIATTIKTLIEKVRDDDWITVNGYIIEQLSSEQYLFKDNAGEIELDIDSDAWSNLRVTPSTKVRVHGEVNRDINRQDREAVSIEVERIELD